MEAMIKNLTFMTIPETFRVSKRKMIDFDVCLTGISDSCVRWHFVGGERTRRLDLEAIDIIQQKIIVNKVMEGVKEERSGQILDTF